MSNFPDFSGYGYQASRELGHNYLGARITYLATDTRSQQTVVIKQFQFAKFNSNWSGFKAYEREIQVLKGLNHPGIPRYLDSFETPDGFCMVQEYKNAEPLSVPRSFDPDEIKQVAVSILSILVYLQNRIPPVIHRDIKPENILVDEQLNVYLVDFGFARIGDGEVAMSSVALGTLGFMPPEQLYNRQLTEATDLYSLGLTLICLLTGTKSTAIDTLIDEDNRLNFKPLVPKLSLRFIDWLEKLVQPNPKNRYANATAALEALKPIYVIRLPEVQLSQDSLEFKATKLGENLTQTITISNPITETVLEGSLEVAPHKSDPPHTPDSHSWIKLTPAKFASNQTTCRITVDTSQLMADKIYKRQILLHTNSTPETYLLTVQVKTAESFGLKRNVPYSSLVILGVTCFSLFWVVPLTWQFLVILNFPRSLIVILIFLFFAGVFYETIFGDVAKKLSSLEFEPGFERIQMKNVFVVLFIGLWVVAFLGIIVVGVLIYFSVWCSVLAGASIVSKLRNTVAEIEKQGFTKLASFSIVSLTIWLGTLLGVWVKLGEINPHLLEGVLGTGLLLAGMVLFPHLEQRRLIAKYRQSEQHLIKP